MTSAGSQHHKKNLQLLFLNLCKVMEKEWRLEMIIAADGGCCATLVKYGNTPSEARHIV